MASVDSPERNAEFAKSLGANFVILSDPDKTAARAFGVLSDAGYAKRWTFYIDSEGIIRHIVVRFELGEGLHIYGEPVPEGMVPMSVEVFGPPGLEVGEPIGGRQRDLFVELLLGSIARMPMAVRVGIVVLGVVGTEQRQPRLV